MDWLSDLPASENVICAPAMHPGSIHVKESEFCMCMVFKTITKC